MDQNLDKQDSNKSNVKVPTRETDNKKNQCDFATSQAGNVRIHLKKHSGEKTNKCYQCDFASSYASALRTHLKTHSERN